jgi:hypothetical protein
MRFPPKWSMKCSILKPELGPRNRLDLAFLNFGSTTFQLGEQFFVGKFIGVRRERFRQALRQERAFGFRECQRRIQEGLGFWRHGRPLSLHGIANTNGSRLTF